MVHRMKIVYRHTAEHGTELTVDITLMNRSL
jgi:hypothetical protein